MDKDSSKRRNACPFRSTLCMWLLNQMIQGAKELRIIGYVGDAQRDKRSLSS